MPSCIKPWNKKSDLENKNILIISGFFTVIKQLSKGEKFFCWFSVLRCIRPSADGINDFFVALLSHFFLPSGIFYPLNSGLVGKFNFDITLFK